jgi:GDP-4-dehydro-6-deoxy-D-mannose reductase
VRVYVSGERGFVGGWLTRELAAAGHEVVAGPGPDVTDRAALVQHLRANEPDAIAHLAAVAFAPDAAADPARALAVNVGGTLNLMEAIHSLPRTPAVVVVGSSEVYGAPRQADLPLHEGSPLAARHAYGISKVAQESVALAYAAREGWPLCVCRSFNHTGPGQRPVFVVPALARRVHALATGERDVIPVGNLDVSRDFTDVRDVVVAYRLLLEGLADGRIAPGGTVVNVAKGEAVPVRRILETLCRLADVEPRVEADPALVRPDDPPEIRGDASRLQALTGWRPERPLEATLGDVWHELVSRAPAASGARTDT